MEAPYCEIVAGRLPSRIRYQDGEVLMIHNFLEWALVILLRLPKQHLT